MAEHVTPATPDEWLATAEQLRINGSKPAHFQRAISYYDEYAEAGDPRRRFAVHMTGVCYQRLDEHESAVERFLAALEGASDYERGNIERDLSASYGALGEEELAEISIATSLDLFPVGLFPVEHATSLGFLARLQERRGELPAAAATYEVADRCLVTGTNRHSELYNKLNYARALFRTRHPLRGRRVALAAFRLSLTRDPATGRRYGSRLHHLRAAAYVVGGERLGMACERRYRARLKR